MQGGLVLDVEARFRPLFRIRVLPQRLDGFGRAWGEFGGHETDRVQGFRVLDEEARGGGVDDVVRGGFGEDMVGHGVVKEAPDEGLGKGCFLAEVGEGDGRILRDIGSEVVGVDSAEGEDVCELWPPKNVSSGLGDEIHQGDWSRWALRCRESPCICRSGPTPISLGSAWSQPGHFALVQDPGGDR